MSSAVRRFTPALFHDAGKMGKLFCALTALGMPLAATAQELPKPKAEHVVLVIWDGMRPDFIREDTTPNAFTLAKSGTFFANNHAVYISSTEVNGSTLATGMLPRNTGIIANREYRPEVNLIKPVDMQHPWPVRLGDAMHGDHWLLAPTVAETVRAAGFTAAVAGTKAVALLHDRHHDRDVYSGAPIVFEGTTYPKSYADELAALLGKWPDFPKENAAALLGKLMPAGWVPSSNTAQNLWTTRTLIEGLWSKGVPKYSVLWLGDPDYSQHFTQPGAPTALAAIRDCDTHLGMVLAALEKRGVRDKTDVLLVSDHGFSTVERAVDFTEMLRKYGTTAKVPFRAETQFKHTPKPGDVMIIGVGGSTAIYAHEHDAAITGEIVDWLQASDFCGVIYTRDGLPGTFPFSAVAIDSPTPPDIIFSYVWSERANKSGAPGSLTSEGKTTGKGTHASMSRFDIHNTLLAAGPDIRPGLRSEIPSGNVDVAPTIYHLLGIAPPLTLDGRVLTEALAGWAGTSPTAETSRKEITRDLPGGKTWKQWIQTTKFGDKTYLDEGNSSAAK